MLQLRQYQRDAIDSLYAYWAEEGTGNGLIVLPTGAGKALVIAKIIEELLVGYPDLRIVNVTHSATLVGQNFKEFIGLSPFAPAGIFSASLGRRDAHAQVLFCGIQSVANRVADLGWIDLILVDEAHAISRNADTLYGKFFKDIREYNPDIRTVGLTATDYRMDSGSLTEGEDKLFDDVVYEIGLADLIEQGYLTALQSVKTAAKIDLKGIHTRGGDYVPGEMSDAAEKIIEEAIAEDMIASEGCRAGLFFSSSKANAIHIRDAIRRHGRTCEALTSDNSHETDRIFADYRAGKIWAISSVNMIYTGANFPFVDFISLLFGTKSAGKLVQALGRGTRNCEGKHVCLVADHGKNLSYHGPIDQIKSKDPTSGDGEQPKKLCPADRMDVEQKSGCGEMVPISLMKCHCCGYIFPPSEEEKITAAPDATPVLSKGKDMWRAVTGRKFQEHPSKNPEYPPSVKINYMVGFLSVSTWICPQHGEHPVEKSRLAKHFADRYWNSHGGLRPFPATVEAFLLRQHELRPTVEIEIEYNGRYPNAADYRPARADEVLPDNDNETPADNDNIPRGHTAQSWSALLADEIPF